MVIILDLQDVEFGDVHDMVEEAPRRGMDSWNMHSFNVPRGKDMATTWWWPLYKTPIYEVSAHI